MFPELQYYISMIEDLRGQVVALVRDLPAEALNWRPIEGSDDHATNSLAVLATHVAGAERYWISEIIGGRERTRQRDAEFETRTSSASELVERLETTGRETAEVLAALTAENLDEDHDTKGRRVSTRWAILHVIDHTALHLGHMQLTLQLWQGGEAHPDKRWFQRVPPA
jgi:uncharacterized damage-inducible protein DinB